ncbi:hypothetical protein Droror1_Dr00002268 [Drosera rotundifolia]
MTSLDSPKDHAFVSTWSVDPQVSCSTPQFQRRMRPFSPCVVDRFEIIFFDFEIMKKNFSLLQMKLVVADKVVESTRTRVKELEPELAKLKAVEERIAEVKEAERNINAVYADVVFEFRASSSFQD